MDRDRKVGGPVFSLSCCVLVQGAVFNVWGIHGDYKEEAYKRVYKQREGSALSVFASSAYRTRGLLRYDHPRLEPGKGGFNGGEHLGKAEKYCYSCFSKKYEEYWVALGKRYHRPRNFTDMCRAPGRYGPAALPLLVSCTGPCLTITERLEIGGYYVDTLYIRGCWEKTVVESLNRSAVDTHGLLFHENFCRSFLQSQLFATRGLTTHDQKRVNLCVCSDSRCNDGSPAALPSASPLLATLWAPLTLYFLLAS